VNNRYTRDDLDDRSDSGDGREISLGASTILGLFFALALICAVFFGFGYSMGRRSVHLSQNTAQTSQEPTLGNSKPSPGLLLPAPTPASDTDADSSNTATEATPVASPDPAPASTRVAVLPVKPPVAPVAAPVTLSRVSSPAPASSTTSSAIVQVAAVTHQQDADMLLSALKKRGYNAAVRQEPHDNLLHVQLGPFASKKDADAMRQRLLSDGYNAIVK